MSLPGRRHSSGGSLFLSQSFAPFSSFSLGRRRSVSAQTNKARHELTSFSLQYQDSPTSCPDSSQISPRGNALHAGDAGLVLGGSNQSPLLSIGDRLSPNVSDWNEKVIWETRQATQAQQSLPPRAARQGHEWVWFPEGYWAEREQLTLPHTANKRKPRWFDRSSKRDSNPSPKTVSSSRSSKLTTSQSFDVSTGRTSTSGNRERSGSQGSQGSRIIRGLQYMSPTYPHFKSPKGEPEGLYCKARRVVTGNTRVHSPLGAGTFAKESGARRSHTTLLLERTAEYLDHELKDRRQQKVPTPFLTSERHPHSPASSQITTGSRTRRIFGLAPWHRKSSRDSFLSTSSSINDLLRGGTPVVTPLTINTTYESSDGQRYSKVEISSAGAPNFLNSEASRVDTPQTSDEGSIKIHEYFTSTPEAHNDRIPIADSITSPRIPKNTGVPFTKSIGSLKRHRFNTFELNIPEHLPSSPICPKNPKHSSGGTGVCPYHGRQTTICESKIVLYKEKNKSSGRAL